MAAGKVSQDLYLTGLPPGLSFTIQSATTPNTPDFYTYFNRTCPFDVTGTQANPGHIGQCVIASNDVLDSGTPLSIELLYTLDTPTSNLASGYLTIGATDFGALARADYTTLTFSVNGQPPSTVTQTVPYPLLAPDPIYIGFAMMQDQIAIAATPQNLLSTQVLSVVLSGILTAHVSVVKALIRS